MVEPYVVRFADGDVSKMVFTPLPLGGMNIKIYDGTHGDGNDLLIQATVSPDEMKQFRWAAALWDENLK